MNRLHLLKFNAKTPVWNSVFCIPKGLSAMILCLCGSPTYLLALSLFFPYKYNYQTFYHNIYSSTSTYLVLAFYETKDPLSINHIDFTTDQQNIHTKIEPDHDQYPCSQTSIHGESIKIIYVHGYHKWQKIPSKCTKNCSWQLCNKFSFTVWQNFHH